MSAIEQGDADDPIVIVGMAVEAPGGIDTLLAFWDVIAEAREMITPLPRDRGWPITELLAVTTRDGTTTVPDAGGFLTGAAEFDPGFFGISPREAIAMDPQQRVGLRVAWKALENAGVDPASVDGDLAGCYLGASINEYGPRADEVNDYSGHRVTGTALGAVSGRISHCLGLVGPAMTVDTACASALSALHLATNAVRDGECDWALAGGVCVMGSPAAFFEFAINNGLSVDGHCRSYSEGASGTLWGEGAGVVVVERLSRAQRLGHRVYAQVLGTRVNHNGRSGALVVPSADAQQQLIEATLAAAKIDACEIGMVEGHGTATPIGDKLELTALANTYGKRGSPVVGSLKTNFGHAQAASGALGLIKTLLCGAAGSTAPTLFSDSPTGAIDWDTTGLRLATKVEPWRPTSGMRYGAVSSFGVAGSNAHAVLAMPALQEPVHA
ncbi:polyketide synthase [Skermania sp. ID1734]|uniref:beta-ketoacyl [acyl carrier protein] synthase domain-containing protein n=1 Tax=Skermania sp. ID1734 TaxID=2597516 RepID=UPI00117CDB54|nr:polyketide synthase [Skermania sp. ID1734]TSE01434.1 polyketide synthase [Skermania sp. ID1734]